MGNPIYQQLGNTAPANPMIQQFLQFKKNFNGLYQVKTPLKYGM